MSLLASPRGGHRLAPLSAYAFAGLAAWIAPVPVGLALSLIGRVLPPEPALVALVVGAALTLAPVYSWIGVAVLVPGAAALMAAGLFGWAAAAAWGAAAGWLATAFVGGTGPELPVALGTACALVFRTVIGRLAPAAVG